MEKKKINIVASFSRKKQVAQYEPVDYFSSRSMELDEGATLEEQREAHKELFALCVLDVMEDMKIFSELTNEEDKGVGVKRLLELVQLTERGEAITVEEYEKLNQGQLALLNEAKKAYKRSMYVSRAKEK